MDRYVVMYSESNFNSFVSFIKPLCVWKIMLSQWWYSVHIHCHLSVESLTESYLYRYFWLADSWGGPIVSYSGYEWHHKICLWLVRSKNQRKKEKTTTVNNLLTVVVFLSLLLPILGEYHWVLGCGYVYGCISSALKALSSARKLNWCWIRMILAKAVWLTCRVRFISRDGGTLGTRPSVWLRD